MSEAFCAAEGYGGARDLRRQARFDEAGGTPPLLDHGRRIEQRATGSIRA